MVSGFETSAELGSQLAFSSWLVVVFDMVTRSKSWLKSLPLIGSGCRLSSLRSLSNNVKIPRVMRSAASLWYGSFVATRSTVLLGCPFCIASTVIVAEGLSSVQRYLQYGNFWEVTESWVVFKWSQGYLQDQVTLRSEVDSIQRGAGARVIHCLPASGSKQKQWDERMPV